MKQVTYSLQQFANKERHALSHIRKQLIKAAKPELLLLLTHSKDVEAHQASPAAEQQTQTIGRTWELLLVVPATSPLHGNSAEVDSLQQQLQAWGKVRLMVFTADALTQAFRSRQHPRITLHTPAVVLYEKDKALHRILQWVQSADDPATSPPDVDESPFCAIALSPEEQMEPHRVIQSFFREYALPDVRLQIAQWMHAVRHSPSWLVEETAACFHFYEAVCRLLEAAWRLRKLSALLPVPPKREENRPEGLPDQDYFCPHAGADAWEYFPHHLSRAEFYAPQEVFNGLFRIRGLKEWQQELHELFGLSLSTLTPQDLGEIHDTQGIERQLNRLAEACHLLWIWQRRRQDAALQQAPPVGSQIKDPL